MSKKHKHLSFDDRLEIEYGLKNDYSFKHIAKIVEKDCTTISKEIRNHFKIVNSGAVGRSFFDCVHGKECKFREKGIMCNSSSCEHYEKNVWSKLKKAPYVCNGCKNKYKCTLTKHIYDASYAQKEYNDIISESKQGVTLTNKEIDNLNNILKPLIVIQKQSIHHACINNKNKIMISERNIYNLIDKGILDIKNIDLPRKIRYRLRTKKTTYYKIDKQCLNGRKYVDFLSYMKENPDTPLVEIDTVEGVKGGKVLLTIHFVQSNFMLAFIRERNDAQSVIDIFNNIENILGINEFKLLFKIILADNGSEFSNPMEIEFNKSGECRTQIFYCEPGRPDQKGSCEVNHELIRRILPSGDSFDNYEQKDINKMMSHVNSYKRKKLNDCSPLQLFSLIYGKDIAEKLGIIEIQPNQIDLSKNLFK